MQEKPEEINRREIMEYYGYKGRLGLVRLSFRLFKAWFLQYLASRSPYFGLTVKLQRMRGVKIGKHVYIGSEMYIDLLYPHLITIEDYVSIGMRCMIFAHSNPTTSLEIKQKYYPRICKPVVIKRGAWIAPGSIILAGVTIGENSIVGAGSVVVCNVEPYTVVGGTPAKFIKSLRSINDKNKTQDSKKM